MIDLNNKNLVIIVIVSLIIFNLFAILLKKKNLRWVLYFFISTGLKKLIVFYHLIK